MTPTAAETVRLWLATLGDPLAIIVFGAILVQRLTVLQMVLREELREGFDKIVSAVHEQTKNVVRIGKEADDRP